MMTDPISAPGARPVAVSIVVPVRNEADNIAPLIAEIGRIGVDTRAPRWRMR